MDFLYVYYLVIYIRNCSVGSASLYKYFSIKIELYKDKNVRYVNSNNKKCSDRYWVSDIFENIIVWNSKEPSLLKEKKNLNQINLNLLIKYIF